MRNEHPITRFTIIDSPVGPLTLVDRGRGLAAIHFSHEHHPAAPPDDAVEDSRHFSFVRHQIDEYFRADRTDFDVDLAPEGTPFQLEVWNELRTIPAGETRSYGEIARAIHRPAAFRAVGAANGRNPIPIIIPCHRVIGADGSLTGFGGGLDAKRWLLEHERRMISREG